MEQQRPLEPLVCVEFHARVLAADATGHVTKHRVNAMDHTGGLRCDIRNAPASEEHRGRPDVSTVTGTDRCVTDIDERPKRSALSRVTGSLEDTATSNTATRVPDTATSHRGVASTFAKTFDSSSPQSFVKPAASRQLACLCELLKRHCADTQETVLASTVSPPVVVAVSFSRTVPRWSSWKRALAD